MRWLAAVVLAVLLLPGRVAFTCDCMRLPALSPAVVTESDLIFAGKALEVVERSEHTSRMRWGGATGETRFLEKWVEFEVIRAWRGVDHDTVLIDVDNSDCSFQFEPGESYLVFADGVREGKPLTTECMRTARLDTAAPILKMLGPARSRHGGAARVEKPVAPKEDQ